VVSIFNLVTIKWINIRHKCYLIWKTECYIWRTAKNYGSWERSVWLVTMVTRQILVSTCTCSLSFSFFTIWSINDSASHSLVDHSDSDLLVYYIVFQHSHKVHKLWLKFINFDFYIYMYLLVSSGVPCERVNAGGLSLCSRSFHFLNTSRAYVGFISGLHLLK
jgi:hypothetical protein